VRQGQLLCALDKRELSLQLVRWQSERDQYQRQHREAMATGNRANMRVLREQINRAEAQIGLLEDQLQHSQLLAPFDGYIVSGDLSQSLGSPVEKGAVLFEVAPLGNYRVKLKVDEHDISAIKVGQQGMLILNSLPDLDLPITVQKVTPVSATEEGENLFVVEARINQESERLRPGMEGVGKIVIGKRKLIWVLAHDIIDWFRLWLWSWWP
jgi:multidrug resistance efflux pump